MPPPGSCERRLDQRHGLWERPSRLSGPPHQRRHVDEQVARQTARTTGHESLNLRNTHHFSANAIRGVAVLGSGACYRARTPRVASPELPAPVVGATRGGVFLARRQVDLCLARPALHRGLGDANRSANRRLHRGLSRRSPAVRPDPVVSSSVEVVRDDRDGPAPSAPWPATPGPSSRGATSWPPASLIGPPME